MNKGGLAAAVAPSFGPAIVTLFGIQIPIVAMSLSLLALLLARKMAKPPARKLTRGQELSLTALLVLVLFLVVTGELITEEPLGPGLAVMWAIGLGLSGVLILELFAEVVIGWIKRFTAAFRAASPPVPPED